MADGRLGGEPEVRPAQRLGHVRVQLGEALDVQLVDDGLVPRRLRRAIVPPGKRIVHNRGERRVRGAVAIVGRRAVGRAHAKREQRVVPPRRASDDLGVGVHDQLARVEAMAVLRRVGAVDAIAVELTGVHVGEVAVPHHVGVLGQRDRQRLHLGVDRVEEAELDAGGVLGKDREVDADTVPRRP